MTCNIEGFSISLLGAHAIDIIFVCPHGSPIGHGYKLAVMLPGIGSGVIGQHVANGVAGNGLAVIAVQQVTVHIIIKSTLRGTKV